MRTAVTVLLVIGLAGSAAWPASARQGQGSGAAPAPPPPVTTGLILGTVVDAATGRPVPDAVVTLNMRALAGANAGGRGNPGGPPAPPPMPAVLTSGDGRFLFRDLPKGPAQLIANSPGYVNGVIGQSRPNGPSRPLDLAEGEHLTGVVVKMWKYATITGTIVDEAGEPAVATSVRALRRVESAGRVLYTQSGNARTDDRGIFRMSQLVPGDYLVVLPHTQLTTPADMTESLIRAIASGTPGGEGLFDLMSSGVSLGAQGGTRVDDVLYSTDSTRGPAIRPDGRLSVYQTLYFPGAATASAATPITLRSGEERTGVDMQLRLVTSARVSGVVTGPMGPVPNVAVRLSPASPDGQALADEQTATTSTRPDGTFTFIGVPAGQYVARVNKPPSMSGRGMGPIAAVAFGGAPTTPPTGQAAMALYGNVPVTVNASDVPGVAIALTQGAKVSGRVVFQGTAALPDPRQLQNIGLTSLDPAVVVMGAGGPNRPDETGAFSTIGYAAGRYAVTVLGAPGPGWMLSSITTAGRDVLDTGLELKDADITDVVVTYSDRIGQISGTVHGSGGTAASTATVVIVPAGYRPGLIAGNQSPRRARTVTAQKTGAYTINLLSAGDFVIAAFDDADVGDLQDAAFITGVLRVGTRIAMTDGEKKSLDLQVVKVTR